MSPKLQNAFMVPKVENALVQHNSKIDQQSELYCYYEIEKNENETPMELVIKDSFLGFHGVKK